VALELTRAVEHRRRRGCEPPSDLLDVVVGGAGPDASAADLAEVFLSFVFAIVGSVGFTLGWSVYLLGTNPTASREPVHVVREALRLWPVAWMLARRPTRPHDVLGHRVTPRDHVVVCPYLVHRNPRYWDEPTRFRPERWASADDRRAFIPFGWGPHTCVAGSLSIQLAANILRVFLDGFEPVVRAHGSRPHVGAALAPPRFTLEMTV
jgi:cytochrome P450